MTPTQIEEHARQRFNAVSDSFFTQAEILNLIYAACIELSSEVPELVERVYTSSTVEDQREYSFPTNTIKIKRIEYEGKKLQPITMVEDDALTLNNSATTASGTPQYYSIWNETIYLRPIPSDVGDLTIYSYNEPQTLTISSTLEIPTMFHMGLVDFIVAEMAAKDQNLELSDFYRSRFNDTILKAKKWAQRKKRGDSFSTVKDEESLPYTILGGV